MRSVIIDAGPYVKRTDEFCYEADMLDSNKRMLIGTTFHNSFVATVRKAPIISYDTKRSQADKRRRRHDTWLSQKQCPSYHSVLSAIAASSQHRCCVISRLHFNDDDDDDEQNPKVKETIKTNQYYKRLPKCTRNSAIAEIARVGGVTPFMVIQGYRFW